MTHINKKKTGRHTTVIDAANEVVQALLERPDVSKVTLGRIVQKKGNSTKRTIKAVEISGGLRVTVSGSKTVQRIHVYSSDAQGVQKFLEKRFS